MTEVNVYDLINKATKRREKALGYLSRWEDELHAAEAELTLLAQQLNAERFPATVTPGGGYTIQHTEHHAPVAE